MKIKWIIVFLGMLSLSACQRLNKNVATKTIAIQPLGEIQTSLILNISNSLRDTYGQNIIVQQEIKMYPDAFINIKSPRYRADSILKFLKRDKPDSVDYILGVTAQDISTTKYEIFPIKIKQPESKYKDWGVFGLGQCPGNSCVISTFRIGKVTEQLKTVRMQKVAVHEVGHNFGLKHCKDKSCVMTDAVESIKTVDQAQLALCDKCKRKLGIEE